MIMKGLHRILSSTRAVEKMASPQKNSMASTRPKAIDMQVLTVVVGVPEKKHCFVVGEDLLEFFRIQREGLTEHLKALVQSTDPAHGH